MSKHIDKVALVIVREGKMLMTRKEGRDKFYFPGGRREEGESDEETLAREIREELNCHLDPGDLTWYCEVSDHAHGEIKGTQVTARTYWGRLDGEPVASSEIIELAWLDSSDMDKVTGIGAKLFMKMKEEGHIN